ncbi:MAG: hypothetical protein ABH824_04275 [Nanoarchaeota archaeon]
MKNFIPNGNELSTIYEGRQGGDRKSNEFQSGQMSTLNENMSEWNNSYLSERYTNCNPFLPEPAKENMKLSAGRGKKGLEKSTNLLDKNP